jgi:hypothetical protein
MKRNVKCRTMTFITDPSPEGETEKPPRCRSSPQFICLRIENREKKTGLHQPVRGENKKREKTISGPMQNQNTWQMRRMKKMEKRSPKAWLQLGMSHARKKNIIDHAPMTDGVCG